MAAFFTWMMGGAAEEATEHTPMASPSPTTTSATTTTTTSSPPRGSFRQPSNRRGCTTKVVFSKEAGKQESPAPMALGGQSTASGEVRFDGTADLFRLDTHMDAFLPLGQEVTLQVRVLGDLKKEFRPMLFCCDGDTGAVLFSQPISTAMQMSFDRRQRAVVWVCKTSAGLETMSVRVHALRTLKELHDAVQLALAEAQAHKPVSRLRTQDREMVCAVDDFEVPMDESDDEDDEAGYSDDEEEELVDGGLLRCHGTPKGASAGGRRSDSNSALSVAWKHERSFVARGSAIGVFDHTPERTVEYRTTIDVADGKRTFSPHQMLSTDDDRKMMLLDRTQPKCLFRMDMERGEMVDVRPTGENEVHMLTPLSKFGQRDGEQVVMGLNQKGAFLLDPRLPGSPVVEMRTRYYGASSNPMITCAATTADGHVVTGSKTGEVRMFNAKTFAQDIRDPLDRKLRAKTTLVGLGDPILGVDVTADGTWVLVTCKNYLYVLPSKQEGHSGLGHNAFERSIGGRDIAPRKLTLSLKHVREVGGEVSFTPAKFNTTGSYIVTSTGNWLIRWNFRQVKMGHLLKYTVCAYQQDVIAEQPTMESDRSFVVALRDNVAMAK
jgi:VID27 C-terminal WD40-like domain